LVVAILYLWLSACTFPGQSDKPPLVDYCELVTNPSQYDGQIVRVRGTHDAGWEWSYLTDRKCSNEKPDIAQTWLMIPDDAWCEGVRQTNTSLPPEYSRSVSLKREVIVLVTYHYSKGAPRGSSKMDLICLEKAEKWQLVR
jgi:hypothetical protein